MKKFFQSRNGAILIIVFIALLVRLYAAVRLPMDFDEPVYLQVAHDYARLQHAGDFQGFINYPQSREHPPLTKWLFSLPMLVLGSKAGFTDALLASRMISVFWGTLAVWLLAILDPVAGFLLAIQTYAVKYTSQTYLESLPLFASMGSLFTLLWSRRRRDRWFWLSSFALGITAAGKYSYLPILIVVMYVFLRDKKYPWQDLLLYLGVAGLTFLAFDPALWSNPPMRLWESLVFHAQYAQGAHVAEGGYPWYQPFLWLSRSYPYIWHPDVFFYNPMEGLLSIDGMISVAALVGLYFQWRERRWVVIWVVSSVFLLLLWPTKWPQYTLVVIPAFCLAASAALQHLGRYLRRLEDYYGWLSMMFPAPQRFFWIILVLVLSLGTLFTLANGVSLSLAHHGWSHLMKDQTPLPSNQVNALLRSPDGRMIAGTEDGLAFWKAAVGDELQDEWKIVNTKNSGLPDDHILSLHTDAAGWLWVGTQNGLIRFDGQSWTVYHAQEMGLPSDVVHDIQSDSRGNIWVATNQGISVYEEGSWTPYPVNGTSTLGNFVLSLAVDPQPGYDAIYAGTGDGLMRLNFSSDEWQRIEPARFNVKNGGISDLLVDSSGRLWVATLGNGLSVQEGDSWKEYRTSNSGLPTNRVERIYESQSGAYWISASFPERPGGVLALFQNAKWKTYQALYSGYSGASSSAIEADSQGRLWFGTQTEGIDIFDVPK